MVRKLSVVEVVNEPENDTGLADDQTALIRDLQAENDDLRKQLEQEKEWHEATRFYRDNLENEVSNLSAQILTLVHLAHSIKIERDDARAALAGLAVGET
jgi:hypothetical protein